MQRELLLLRHGKSDWHQELADFQRPLNHRGARNAAQIGSWLVANDLLPGLILSSPATRAMQTARRLRQALATSVPEIQPDERIYAAALDSLLTLLADIPDTPHRVLLIGHNPGLEELLHYLAGADVAVPANGKLLPTATLAHLQMPAQWQDLAPGSARLLAIIRPGSLPGD